MAILPITVYGDRILREKAKEIKNIDSPLIKTISDMFETMRYADGIGLAANQVGLDKSLFIIDLSPVEEFEKTKPMVFINPKILLRSDEKSEMEEGCLSLPNLRMPITRPEFIKLEYLDTDENIQSLEVEGFMARVIQHEFDHLIGKVIADRLDPFTKKKFKDDLLKLKRGDFEVPYLTRDNK